MAIRATLAATALLFAIVTETVGGSVRSDGSGARSAPVGSRIAVIVLENREFGDVIGNPNAPFLNGLARRGALATRYYAITHPSLPNYLAMLGGSTFGVQDNCTDCSARGPNLAQQLSRAGVPWRAYMEGLPQSCYLGEAAGAYVKRHNPFVYFPSVTANRRRCANVVPTTRLDADLHRHALPGLSWIVPGLCHGGHDCGIDIVDAYLARLIPRLTRQLGPDGFLTVTFDEGRSDAGCCGVAAGGRIATILKGAPIRSGIELGQRFTHYSLLATIEDAFGLSRLRHARSARSLRPAFRPGAGTRIVG